MVQLTSLIRIAFATAAVLIAGQVAAFEKDAKPVLVITGKIAPPGGDDTVEFSRADLESLGMETIETTTPWYEGPVKFEGVSLEKLMKHVGATGESVTVVALNDYSSEIPVSDFAEHDPILALKRNGKYMPITDKGPLFIIYPFDRSKELSTQKYFSRAVWQVGKFVIH